METSKSRYGTKREFILLKDQILVKCYDTLYYTMTNDNDGSLTSVDPNGGPNIHINKIITIDKIDYVVTKINKYEKYKNSLLNILVDVIIKF
jgi:hypothetical protein